MNTAYKQPIDRLKRHMAEYQPQLKRAIVTNSESRPSSELFINIKVELIDNSVQVTTQSSG